MRTLICLSLGVFLLSHSVFAATESNELELPELTVSQPSQSSMGYSKEMGMSLGTPGGVNFNLGIWGFFVFRISGMYLGEKMTGGQLEVGYPLNRESEFKQYLGIQAISSAFDLGKYRWEWTGLGPVYGVHWKGLTGSLGVNLGSGTQKRLLAAKDSHSSRYSPFEPTQSLGSVMATVQIGYSFYF